MWTVSNILHNAILYTQDRGKVEIHTAKTENGEAIIWASVYIVSCAVLNTREVLNLPLPLNALKWASDSLFIPQVLILKKRTLVSTAMA